MLQLQKFVSYIGFTNLIAQNVPVVDPGEGPGRPGPSPPLILDQTEAQRAEKIFFETAPRPPYVRVWITGHPPYLKVWIRHCVHISYPLKLTCESLIFAFR